ncbi:hypothetical protein K2X85_02495 [bacterium]|nr:hypothetical protein [bacterium]
MPDWTDWTSERVDSLLFAYPSSWTLETDRSEEGTSVLLQSDGVSFGLVGIYPVDFSPEELTEQVLESVRDEHPGLEIEELSSHERSYRDASAFEGLFMTLDTVAYCWVRSWRVGRRTVVVFIQSIQAEAADGEEVFGKICQSISTKAGAEPEEDE